MDTHSCDKYVRQGNVISVRRLWPNEAHTMKRRDFLKSAGAAATCGLFPRHCSLKRSLIPATRATNVPAVSDFKTKHCIVVLYGYLMTGRDIAHYTTGSVRTLMFEDAYGLPEYEVRHGFGNAL